MKYVLSVAFLVCACSNSKAQSELFLAAPIPVSFLAADFCPPKVETYLTSTQQESVFIAPDQAPPEPLKPPIKPPVSPPVQAPQACHHVVTYHYMQPQYRGRVILGGWRRSGRWFGGDGLFGGRARREARRSNRGGLFGGC